MSDLVGAIISVAFAIGISVLGAAWVICSEISKSIKAITEHNSREDSKRNIYGVAELKNAEGETIKVFKIESNTPVGILLEESLDGTVDFFDNRKEAEELYYKKLDTFISAYIDKQKKVGKNEN